MRTGGPRPTAASARTAARKEKSKLWFGYKLHLLRFERHSIRGQRKMKVRMGLGFL